ncbi:MAG: hypothetical protein KKE23_03480 [Nanoarchaeota archaeon]|nr:hypothetical protein [Nanoarchaeota archaeon]
MKHEVKITAILLLMFLATQLIGLAVIDAYSPKTITTIAPDGTQTVEVQNVTIPYGMDPPKMDPQIGFANIAISLVIAILIFVLLMKIQATTLIRAWFTFVSLITISIALNAIFIRFFPGSDIRLEFIALGLALPLTFYKIFKRNIIVHNATELLIYPGLAAIFVPILNVWAIIVLLFIISIYDMYAVWKSSFMVGLAKYQIQNLKIFTGFFIPYITKNQLLNFRKAKGKLKKSKVKVSLAILGGGDVAFPLIFAGVMLRASGLIPALIIVASSTIALLALFAYSRKGKFYPAMPFITLGCLIGWLITLLL